jgi:hypothetical protein
VSVRGDEVTVWVDMSLTLLARLFRPVDEEVHRPYQASR